MAVTSGGGGRRRKTRRVSRGAETLLNEVPMPEDMRGIMGRLAGGIGASEPPGPPVDNAMQSLTSALPQQMPEMDENRRRILQMLAQQFGRTQ